MTGKLLDKAQIWERNIYDRYSEPQLIAEIPQKDVRGYLCDTAQAHNAENFKQPGWSFATHTKLTMQGWHRSAEDTCARFLGIVAVRREGDPKRKESNRDRWEKPPRYMCVCTATAAHERVSDKDSDSNRY